jgi:hypothetical protein
VQTMIVLKISLYILIHTEIKLGVIFLELTVVVDSRLCQLYGRGLCMIGSPSMLLSLSMILKRICVCLNRA